MTAAGQLPDTPSSQPPAGAPALNLGTEDYVSNAADISGDDDIDDGHPQGGWFSYSNLQGDWVRRGVERTRLPISSSSHVVVKL